ncbi:hypothetical protein BpHYR1_022125 [Brachionus plicatilis]|uniref:Uncharacterized protein n=1 Tax=Brachionus plicatilis TaxID=10195 RepID=A0A3M7SF34_BRAPC|nr:hypothetical protein BpHYR1_022125 [Brachionus plicatilis]
MVPFQTPTKEFSIIFRKKNLSAFQLKHQDNIMELRSIFSYCPDVSCLLFDKNLNLSHRSKIHEAELYMRSYFCYKMISLLKFIYQQENKWDFLGKENEKGAILQNLHRFCRLLQKVKQELFHFVSFTEQFCMKFHDARSNLAIMTPNIFTCTNFSYFRTCYFDL